MPFFRVILPVFALILNFAAVFLLTLTAFFTDLIFLTLLTQTFLYVTLPLAEVSLIALVRFMVRAFFLSLVYLDLTLFALALSGLLAFTILNVALAVPLKTPLPVTVTVYVPAFFG